MRVARSSALAALRADSAARGESVGCWARRVSVSSAAGRDSDAMSSVRALLISLSAARSCWNSSERMTLVSWVSVQLWMSQRSSAESEPSVRSRVSCAVSLSSFVPWIIMGVFSALMIGGTRVVLGGRGVCAHYTRIGKLPS